MKKLLILCCLSAVVVACGSDEDPTDAERAELLWNDISDHESWGQYAGATGVVESATPHADMADIRVNATGLSNEGEPAYGTIIVKRNLLEDGTTLDALTVMQRIEGYNPTAGDWFWVKYDNSGTGTVAMTGEGVMLAGTPGGCIGCHGGADPDDYVTVND